MRSLSIWEFIERNDKGENLVAKAKDCEIYGNRTDNDYCLYWKKTLVIIKGESYNICTGKKSEKAKIISIDHLEG